jgi:hypothetical protein
MERSDHIYLTKAGASKLKPACRQTGVAETLLAPYLLSSPVRLASLPLLVFTLFNLI